MGSQVQKCWTKCIKMPLRDFQSFVHHFCVILELQAVISRGNQVLIERFEASCGRVERQGHCGVDFHPVQDSSISELGGRFIRVTKILVLVPAVSSSVFARIISISRDLR
uniref:Uncharacterized protein LOC104233999 n=1 Tax=Nicotiana sylvestris TaxID=4096 RepID=A0A1U7X4J2_NICSY|nr:PREDICTED: uncharacterized protein LOC104233999 [Nicotiana sylvestris]XP_009785783.1 PREDICTED: uncharacterized protein LOC104233999 [Nicotiana sylvestris]